MLKKKGGHSEVVGEMGRISRAFQKIVGQKDKSAPMACTGSLFVRPIEFFSRLAARTQYGAKMKEYERKTPARTTSLKGRLPRSTAGTESPPRKKKRGGGERVRLDSKSFWVTARAKRFYRGHVGQYERKVRIGAVRCWAKRETERLIPIIDSEQLGHPATKETQWGEETPIQGQVRCRGEQDLDIMVQEEEAERIYSCMMVLWGGVLGGGCVVGVGGF